MKLKVLDNLKCAESPEEFMNDEEYMKHRFVLEEIKEECDNGEVEARNIAYSNNKEGLDDLVNYVKQLENAIKELVTFAMCLGHYKEDNLIVLNKYMELIGEWQKQK